MPTGASVASPFKRSTASCKEEGAIGTLACCWCFRKGAELCWREARISATLSDADELGKGWTVTILVPGDLLLPPVVMEMAERLDGHALWLEAGKAGAAS